MNPEEVTMLLLLLGCGEGASIDVKAGAPFTLQGKHALWAESEANTTHGGQAALVITDTAIGCGALTNYNLFDDFDRFSLEGSGLLFALFFDAGRDGLAGFEGLWMTGYAYGNDAERQMAMLTYSDGFLYLNYAWYYGLSGGTWLQIDAVGDTVTGSFASDYWSGTFRATNCGKWDEGGGGRDSYDYYYYYE